MRNHERLEGGRYKFTYQATHDCGWKGEKHEALPQPGEETPSREDAWVARLKAAHELSNHIRDCQKAFPGKFPREIYKDLFFAFPSHYIRVQREPL